MRGRISSCVFLAALAFVCAFSASAQAPAPEAAPATEAKAATPAAEPKAEPAEESFFSPMGGMGYFILGGRWIDTGSMGDALNERDYSNPTENYLSIGGGGFFFFGPLIMGGEGHGVMGIGTASTSADQTYTAEVSAGYGLLRLGYDVVSVEGFNLYPLLGLGGGTVQLSIYEDTDVTFTQALGNPRHEVHMYRDSFLVDLALGVDYRFEAPHGKCKDEKKCERKEGKFLVIGLRGGYMFAPVESNWHMAGGTVFGGPDIGVDGPFVQLVVGFGGWHIGE